MKLKEVVLEFGPILEKRRKLLPSQRRAMAAILACRTPEAGELIVRCPDCGKLEYRPLSCGHRNCPTCQNHETSAWLDRQTDKLLPVPYFLVTFTIPCELRRGAWRHQRQFYSAMFDASSKALGTLAAKKRFLGGEIGMTGVLHTHGRRLQFHPHIHYIVPAGAIDRKNNYWKRKGWHFLVPEKAVARLFRRRLLASLQRMGIEVPQESEMQDWVVNCREVGSGEPALKYLSRYLYRGVVAENRISRCQSGMVAYRYRESKTNSWKTLRLRGEDFLFLVLQHVLPQGFRRVRDFGFLHGNARGTLRVIQLLLRAKVPEPRKRKRPVFRCGVCGAGMSIIAWSKRGVTRIRDPPECHC